MANKLDVFLDNWAQTIINGAIQGFYNAREYVEQSAKATTTYKDDTTATRESTRAVVFESADMMPDEVFESIEAALDQRPGSASGDSIPDMNDLLPDQIALVSMSATNYSLHLNTRNGGESMYLEHSVIDTAFEIMLQVQEAVDQEVRDLAAFVASGDIT